MFFNVARIRSDAFWFSAVHSLFDFGFHFPEQIPGLLERGSIQLFLLSVQLDSSISVDYLTRHVFIDMLILADTNGVVDMTFDAISRRANMPAKMVRHAIQKLSAPDPDSRSPEEGGRRIAEGCGWCVDLDLEKFFDRVRFCLLKRTTAFGAPLGESLPRVG